MVKLCCLCCCSCIQCTLAKRGGAICSILHTEGPWIQLIESQHSQFLLLLIYTSLILLANLSPSWGRAKSACATVCHWQPVWLCKPWPLFDHVAGSPPISVKSLSSESIGKHKHNFHKSLILPRPLSLTLRISEIGITFFFSKSFHIDHRTFLRLNRALWSLRFF